ncbi:V-type ATP synthase subunit E [Thermovirga lienii]|jgi:V/A-type H+-transporting ATPase subunit E|uniref:V-type ATP synthase subunit E n=1 Tax=Thermovirga lienii TaxID=336261 RepID=UPI000745F8AC|nr:MAG: V-type proton ATPase subunit E [Thermovirga lienii]MDN5318516.1 V/A-type H+/Na+-transporting ATPase subunit [Thermovirga sp.]MDN5367954.1 V/A-type H+/Na+-transporting ATPase subunit [Thermovirga sp.]HCD71116.1 hypothetical protein [Thermovirga lienii]
MSLQDIKKKIEAEAQQEAKEILERAKKEAEKIKEQTEEEIKKIKDQYDKKLSAEKPEIFRRKKVVANLEIKKMELGSERYLVDLAFEKAVEQLSNMDKEKYSQFMSVLLEKAAGDGSGTLLVGENEDVITKEWVEGFNKSHKASIVLGKQHINTAGGFILNKDKVDVNCTFEALVKSLREDIEVNVFNKLFSS